jgi:CO/xanthine dehydrogenase Mo-binding subunit/aerobic-type carbon monoxide dehydrogenase small subunit (CoxS/CutS family)
MTAPAILFTLNGRPARYAGPPTRRLSQALRENLGRRDVKVGCNAGDCGACTVLIDGAAVCACMVPAGRIKGARVETLAGLGAGDPLMARLQSAFLRHGAAQCGICTPGMLVSAIALLRVDPQPSEDAVMEALAGVLCRCTGYRKIVRAVREAHRTKDDFPEPPAGKAVGAGVVRLDGRAKVEGSEKFGDDVAPADALCVRVIRSPHHHARFALGDLDAFLAARPGLLLALTAANVPGRNRFGVIPAFADQPVFAEGVARFRGEAVAAVVGEDSAVEVFAEEDFPVTWQPLPALLTPEEAESEGAPLLHAARGGNLLITGLVERGDVKGALAGADVVVEHAVETGFVEHAYIEPEAGFARRVGDRLEVHACTQSPHMDRDEVAAIMGFDRAQVRIVPTATGGGFGSKLDISLQPYVALAAWVTGRPARIAYSRQESMASTTKRHPASMRIRVGASRDGRLVGLDFTGTFNTGAYASWGPTVANRVPVHASGPYVVPHYRARSRAVHTHCAPAGAFRGFGVPQTAIAQETAFDVLADRVGIDRLEFRLINALDDGVATVTGQVFESGVGIRECLEALRPYWRTARERAARHNSAADGLRRGVGLAAGWYGCGNTSLPNPSTIRAGITADGRVVLHQGAVDIGQGANTVIAQIFADALGVALARIELVGPDTDLTPDAGKTSASRQTYVSGNAARLAGEALRAKVLRLGNVSGEAMIALGAGEIVLKEAGGRKRRIDLAGLPVEAGGYVLAAEATYDPPTSPLDAKGQGIPYAVFGYAAHLVELEVDLALGTVRPLAVVAAHDVGRAINPVLVEGQVEGGIAQGLGMALMEEFVPGRSENLHDYLIPTIGDVPPIETLIVEVADPHGPHGAKGLGEHALIPTAPAVLNAIRDATGATITRLPATPDRVRAAIARTTREVPS